MPSRARGTASASAASAPDSPSARIARSSEPGSRPLPGRDVAGLEQDRPGLRRAARVRERRRPAGHGGERQIGEPLPRRQVRIGRHRASVVAAVQQRDGMDLEVEVVRRVLGVTRVPHEADHVARSHLRAVDREGRERREVRVVELVAGGILQPEAEPADVVPPDRVDDPVGDGENRSAQRSEDVLAVVPAGCRARGVEGVRVRRSAVDREDVAALRQTRDHVRRHTPHRRHGRPIALARLHRLPVHLRPDRASGVVLDAAHRLWLERLGGDIRVADDDVRPGGHAGVLDIHADVQSSHSCVESARSSRAVRRR